MTRRSFLAASLLSANAVRGDQSKPNIVIIYADDLGYGDLACYGAKRVKTPNLDRLAANGIRFTDAHSSAATCTPSRYSLLTGEYSFRIDKARVLPGDAPLLIPTDTTTLPSALKQQGYRTGVIGKWHLGLGSGQIDWNSEIKPGPPEIGFDESFIIPATGDRVPCVYVENHRVHNLDPKDPITVSYQKPVGTEPTGKGDPEQLKMHPSHGHDMTIVNGVSRIGYMTGGRKARWIDEDMARVITNQATNFIARHRSQPFFLYFCTHDIHVPRLPNRSFQRATDMGPRGNAIAELDWSVGQILRALNRHGLTKKILILFTSDNGPVVDDGYRDEAVTKLGDHRPSSIFRGGKYSNFEAGTRVPFIASWPGRIKPDVSDALISQVDLTRALANLTGANLPSGAAPDSENMLPALLGESSKGREHLIEQAGVLSLRHGAWKLISAGEGAAVNKQVNIELGNHPSPQLYNLAQDPGETRNLAAAEPQRVADMSGMLEKIRAAR